MIPKPAPSYAFGPFLLDPSEHLLLRDGQPVPLTPKVFDILRLLVERHGHLVDKALFFEQVWPDSFVEEANLNRSIAVLRKALGESAAGPKYIETVPKRGYRFVAAVTERAAPAGGAAAQDEPRPTSGQFVRGASLPRRGRWTAAGLALACGVLIAWAIGRGDSIDTTGGAPRHRQLTFAGREGAPALSPDGQRIAYVSSGTAERTLVVQELSGGLPLTVFQAPEVMNLRWSPDGSELLFAARGAATDGVFVVARSGGATRRMATRPLIASWSPDGATVVLARYQVGSLEFVNRLGDPLLTITLDGVHRWIADVDWSRRGDRLLIVGNDNEGRCTVWTVRPDGTDQRAIVEVDAEISAARWAPGGDAIYYLRREGPTFSLYKVGTVAPENSTGAGRLVLSGLESDGSFALSADGTTLVYARAPFHSDLWAVDVEGSGSDAVVTTRQLTRDTALVERPRISPDGSSIVFNLGREPTADLYTIVASGGAPQQLTFLNAFSVGGAWSADGRTVAFASTNGGRRRVWTVAAAGGPPHPVSAGDMSDSFDVSWSPGTRILYQQSGNRNFYLLDPVTRDEQPLVRGPDRGWVFSPVVSPDRRRIAVSWSGRPDPGVWLLAPDEGRETLVYGATPPPLLLGWSPDGQAIYGYEGRRANYRGLSVNLGETMTDVRIVALPVDGSTPKTIVALPFEEIGSVAMTPDGRRFVCTVYSSRSEVWLVEDLDRAPGP
jgi:DNA-binding winged helix-turn-helix (wHTH) protein/Tol biopolymer transport system component